MKEYAPLNQGDDESDKPSLKNHIPYPSRSRTHYLWFALGVVTTLATTLVVILSYVLINTKRVPPGLIPDFPTVEVEFRPHLEYSNLTDVASTSLWYDIVHHGHVFVDDASRYSMKPGIPVSAHGERMVVSGFHGLHCLRALREEFTLLVAGHAVETGQKHKSHKGRPDHCLDYLRQLLMCNLDITYESARIDLDGKRRVADGWGTVHQCKDWSSINEWMLENYQLEMSIEDWTPPDPNKPPGQDDLYGQYYEKTGEAQ